MAADGARGEAGASATPGLVLGVDVGGTFTDLLVLDPATLAFRVAKVPTTPRDQSDGFMRGIAELGVDLPATRTIVHGTTSATNAVLERKGSRCALITTAGFGDLLELARRTRPKLFGLDGEFEALIPREMRFEVRERTAADGEVLTPLHEDDVRAAVDELARRGAQSIAIHFLHSYANPANEERCLALVRERWHNDYVSVGSALLPEIREFERGTVAALNAYVQPIVGDYLERLSGRLAEGGFASELLIMQGNGGMMDVATTRAHAVHTVLSGPASGAIAAARIGEAAGMPNLITCDMGGTSFDVSVIVDGAPSITRERSIDYAVPIRLPMIDIHTIGAGGGSIARVTAGGLLQVGPESAGADPGPICYGRGGDRPTVTDANLVLGRINPARITGLTRDVDVGMVAARIHEAIGVPLGLDAQRAAAGIIAVANAAMADAIRFMSIEKGFDPREFAIFAFGGAGPLHASALARELGIPRVLVPPHPGITSALGCVLADVRHDYGLTVNRMLDEVDGGWVDEILAGQAAAGRALIDREAVEVTRVDASHEADFLYQGQTHVMRVPIRSPGFATAAARAEFEGLYRERFDVDLSEMRPMLAALRTTVVGRRPRLPSVAGAYPSADRGREAATTRPVWFDGRSVETRILARRDLGPGSVVAGPAIVEQLDTTTVIAPGDEARVDPQGNLVIAIGRDGGAA